MSFSRTPPVLLLSLGIASSLTSCLDESEAKVALAVKTALAQCGTLCGPGKPGCDDASQCTYTKTRSWTCSGSRDLITTGTCQDGTRFVFSTNGFVQDIRYFSRDGSLKARSARFGVVSPPCYGISFWPEPTTCDAPIVDEVICGDSKVTPDSDEEFLRIIIGIEVDAER